MSIPFSPYLPNTYEMGALPPNTTGFPPDPLQLAADYGDPQSQLEFGLRLTSSDNGAPDYPRAAFYFKLSADCGHPQAQNCYGVSLYKGKSVPINRALAAHYFKLSADQGFPGGQFNFAQILLSGEGISPNPGRALYYFKLAADADHPIAQFNYGHLLCKGEITPPNKPLGAVYLKRAADNGLPLAQALLGDMLTRGDGIPQDLKQAAYYLDRAAGQGHHDSALQYAEVMRLIANSPEMRLKEAAKRIAKLDLDGARDALGNVSGAFRAALENPPECAGRRPLSVFVLLRIGGMLAGRVGISRIRPKWIRESRVLALWKELGKLTVEFLRGIEKSSLVAIENCEGPDEIAAQVLSSYCRDRSVLEAVNEILMRFPAGLIGHFVPEFEGFLSYVTLMQASIEQLRQSQAVEGIVFRGFRNKGKELAAWYKERIADVIVWPEFVVTSKDFSRVLKEFVGKEDGIVFEIQLEEEAIAAKIGREKRCSEVIIGAESAFIVESVERFDAEGFSVPLVKLICVSGWSDDDIEQNPVNVLLPL